MSMRALAALASSWRAGELACAGTGGEGEDPLCAPPAARLTNAAKSMYFIRIISRCSRALAFLRSRRKCFRMLQNTQWQGNQKHWRQELTTCGGAIEIEQT